MVDLIILGGTGYAGGHIAAAAAARRHHVVSYSRAEPKQPLAGVDYRYADLGEAGALAAAVADADVVTLALSPRGALAGPSALRELYAVVADLVERRGSRLGVVGGAGSLLVAAGGLRLADTETFPKNFKAEAREMAGVLDDLNARAGDLDWFYLSPAARFGSASPGVATGEYRVGGDELLVGPDGVSAISGADFGEAFVAEIESGAHRRRRFTVGY